jgi:hypothetical protein
MSKAMKSAKRSKSAAEADTDKEEGKEEARKSLKDKSKKEATKDTKDTGKKSATARSAVILLKTLKFNSLRPVKMTVINLRPRAGEGEVCPRGPAGRLLTSTRITT